MNKNIQTRNIYTSNDNLAFRTSLRDISSHLKYANNNNSDSKF